jgi:hypothetical protein
MNDFIGLYDDAASDEFCDSLINYFTWCKLNNKTWGRDECGAIEKDDTSVTLNPLNSTAINFTYDNLGEFIQEFNTRFWDVHYKKYTKQFNILNSFKTHTIYTYKIQETKPTQGYHIWHCEQSAPEHSKRIAAYILYLNDVIEGGETEFLYLSKRVAAKRGRLLLFPAGYTHTHRGNPPISGTKYIMTGWLEYS